MIDVMALPPTMGPQIFAAMLSNSIYSSGLLNDRLGVYGVLRIEDDLNQPSHGRFATALSVLERF